MCHVCGANVAASVATRTTQRVRKPNRLAFLVVVVVAVVLVVVVFAGNAMQQLRAASEN